MRLFILVLFSEILLNLTSCGGSATGTTATAAAGWTTVTSSGAVVDNNTWTGGETLGISGYFDLTVAPDNTDEMWFVGNQGEVAHSVNGGVTAPIVVFPSTDDPTNGVLRSVVATDSDHIWITGDDNTTSGTGQSVWATTDGGATWTSQANTAATNAGRSITETDRLNKINCLGDSLTCVIAGGYGDNTSLIWTTIDGGANWFEVYNEATTGTDDELNGIFITHPNSSEEVTGLAVGNTGAIVGLFETILDVTTATWTVVDSGTTEDLFGVRCFDAITCLAVGSNGTLLKSTDAGLTWAVVDSGTTEDLATIDTTIDGKAWAGGYNGTVIYSDDEGETWTTQTTDTIYPIQALLMLDENSGFAACANTASNTGAILTTTTGGF